MSKIIRLGERPDQDAVLSIGYFQAVAARTNATTPTIMPWQDPLFDHCYSCGCTTGDGEPRCPVCGLDDTPTPDLVGEQERRDQAAEDDSIAAAYRAYRLAVQAKGGK